jgi:hypothetical protein
LSFSTGDRIEIVERTGSAEDWWTGKCNGQQGVFPGAYTLQLVIPKFTPLLGNYVQDT